MKKTTPPKEESGEKKSRRFPFWPFGRAKGPLQQTEAPPDEELAPAGTLGGASADRPAESETPLLPETPAAPPEIELPAWEGLRMLGKLPAGQAILEGRAEPELVDFVDQLDGEAALLLKQAEDDAPPPAPKNLCRVFVTRDGMSAWAFLFAPPEGEELTAEAVHRAVSAAGVIGGRLEGRVESALANREFFRLFCIARGQPAVDGQDGTVEELFPRERQLAPVEKGGCVDFKDLNWVQTVQKDQVICRLTPAQPGVNGWDVKGRPCTAKAGTEPKLPMGNNVVKNADGTALVAACEGQLDFVKGKFQVSKVLHIQGDVDGSVGNIAMIGDIVIHGNVSEGYTVKASGNVVVQGLVEAAFIEAGGNIHIQQGMMGNSKGRLKAKGEIRCQFMENCIVEARGSIYANSMIGCQISTDESVIVTGGKGIIVGGKVTASNTIEAKSIGTESNRAITLEVGLPAHYWEELRELEKKKQELENTLSQTEKNIRYLESQDAATLSEDRKKMLSQLRLQVSVQRMTLSQTTARLLQMRDKKDHIQSQITAKVIYPPADIAIGTQRMTLVRTAHLCRVHQKDGEILLN